MALSILSRPNPVVAAPMAGVSTPELAAAASASGGIGFLAAAFLAPASLRAEVAAYRTLVDAPVALNLFSPQPDRSAELASQLVAYAAEIAATARKHGVEPGDPRHDEFHFDAKVAYLVAEPVDAVTFTFGPVPETVVRDLQGVGTAVGFTVTSLHEAHQAVALGADFLVAQGASAGGHRGTWHVSDEPNEDSTDDVLSAVSTTGLPVIAAGGVAGRDDVRRLLDAGAAAVAVGTLFVAADEAGSSTAHRDALTSGRFPGTVVTRAFTGRPARALRNAFVADHDGHAPSAYPHVQHTTQPVRQAAATAGDPDAMALWAGSGHAAAARRPARDVVAALWP
ncbi:nitronate monooxygenase [Nocardioides seonyuensis]|uniref:Propionate 3-nitronate monooxygenase n=1 Tax=Nocardioides seonyuensis TaxID=2518371 RepID=A0A4P7IIL7_9ACTN|nr:nitronate monooxygenase [Nocardioides seonyuensis]QBX57226.1 nitronate monooxygenase [Nocardioides seonyuensis]